jgi:hypothetical protein
VRQASEIRKARLLEGQRTVRQPHINVAMWGFCVSIGAATVTGNMRGNNAPASKAEESMTTRFPTPWRIVELPNGFAVEDATGKQIGVFYGRAPCSAGHTGIMTIDEARQMAVDFAKLPELIKKNGNAE